MGSRLAGQVRRMFADGKYHGNDLYEWVGELPIRWAVERAFAWLGRRRRRRPSKGRERGVLSSETFVELAMIHLMLRRLRPGEKDAPFRYKRAA